MALEQLLAHLLCLTERENEEPAPQPIHVRIQNDIQYVMRQLNHRSVDGVDGVDGVDDCLASVSLSPCSFQLRVVLTLQGTVVYFGH